MMIKYTSVYHREIYAVAGWTAEVVRGSRGEYQLTPVKCIFGSAGKMAGHRRMPGTASELKHGGDGD